MTATMPKALCERWFLALRETLLELGDYSARERLGDERCWQRSLSCNAGRVVLKAGD